LANQRDMPWHCVCVTAGDRLRSNRIRSFTRLPQDKFIQSSTFVIIPLLICYSPPSNPHPPHSALFCLTYLHTVPGWLTHHRIWYYLYLSSFGDEGTYGILYNYLSNILRIVYYIIIMVLVPGYNSNHSPSGHQKCK